jgi:hypothetical protein
VTSALLSQKFGARCCSFRKGPPAAPAGHALALSKNYCSFLRELPAVEVEMITAVERVRIGQCASAWHLWTAPAAGLAMVQGDSPEGTAQSALYLRSHMYEARSPVAHV